MRLFSDPVAAIGDVHLRRAAELSLDGRGRSAPNPWIGCVIVAPDGRVVGEGYHHHAGEPHAEVLALHEAGYQARGATAYVTLEPCAHTGRTPPCSEALAAAGISAVLIGIEDPNPLARGGAQRLRDMGVTVRYANPADAAAVADLLEEWLHALATGRPWVTAKVALSLDGRPALHTGVRAEITGTDGAVITRALRRAADAVLVGATTVSADDPALTRRDAGAHPDGDQPLRVVLAGETLPSPAAILFNDGLGPSALLVPEGTSATALRPFADAGVEVALYGGVGDIGSGLTALAGLGVTHVLAETGPRTFTSLWNADAIDALVTVTAGGVAGVQAPSLFRGESTEGESLERRFAALEAGVAGTVAAVQWRRIAADSATAKRETAASAADPSET